MRRFITRKPLVVAVAMLALALVGFFVWQYPRLFPPMMPTDRALIHSFHAHRQTFEALAKMATEDATIASNSEAESLSIARRSEYSRLLSQIDSKMQMGFGWAGVAFSSAHGGIGLSIGPGWEKGIWFLTAVPSRVGQIVKNLDKDPGHDDVYLVPIEGDWYVYYQRTDYDDLPRMKVIRSDQSMKPTAPSRNPFSVFATTPSTSSRLPASLVRFGSSRSRTPAVLFFNDCRGLSLSR